MVVLVVELIKYNALLLRGRPVLTCPARLVCRAYCQLRMLANSKGRMLITPGPEEVLPTTR